MTVGAQLSAIGIDSSITNLSVAMRDLMQQVVNLSMNVNGQGTGLATLESIGYSSADAQTAINAIAYLNTVAEVYFGTATQVSDFDFNNQLSQYWAGR